MQLNHFPLKYNNEKHMLVLGSLNRSSPATSQSGVRANNKEAGGGK